MRKVYVSEDGLFFDKMQECLEHDEWYRESMKGNNHYLHTMIELVLKINERNEKFEVEVQQLYFVPSDTTRATTINLSISTINDKECVTLLFMFDNGGYSEPNTYYCEIKDQNAMIQINKGLRQILSENKGYFGEKSSCQKPVTVV